jgi:hypothetical protein
VTHGSVELSEVSPVVYTTININIGSRLQHIPPPPPSLNVRTRPNMKRDLSEDHDSDVFHSSTFFAKRRRTAASPPSSNPSSQTVTLAEALHSITEQDRIQYWLGSCDATPDLPATMAAPPTPRSASLSDRGRRSVKLSTRSRSSRTPSPNKKPTPQTYRMRNMHHARVHVDNLHKLPPAIDVEALGILGLESWYEPVQRQASAHLAGLAATFQAESRRNARECLLEGDWKASLNNLVRSLADFVPGTLRTHMSEKVWNPNLKPVGPQLDELLGDDDDNDGTRTPSASSTRSTSTLVDFDPSDAAATATPVFLGRIPSLPPSTYSSIYSQSVASTTSFDAANPYHISTPKPDITVGLVHTAFTERHQQRLVNHQASGSILSDPHAAEMGVRFPFLVVEAKGLSVNGSLVSAQNQAAVSGACMLRILRDLDEATHSSLSSPLSPPLCFSIVTEGPVHELWVHFEHNRAFHMESLRTWRTTRPHDADELVHFLANIMNWGRGRFRQSVAERLNNAPEHAVFGG